MRSGKTEGDVLERRREQPGRGAGDEDLGVAGVGLDVELLHGDVAGAGQGGVVAQVARVDGRPGRAVDGRVQVEAARAANNKLTMQWGTIHGHDRGRGPYGSFLSTSGGYVG